MDSDSVKKDQAKDSKPKQDEPEQEHRDYNDVVAENDMELAKERAGKGGVEKAAADHVAEQQTRDYAGQLAQQARAGGQAGAQVGITDEMRAAGQEFIDGAKSE